MSEVPKVGRVGHCTHQQYRELLDRFAHMRSALSCSAPPEHVARELIAAFKAAAASLSSTAAPAHDRLTLLADGHGQRLHPSVIPWTVVTAESDALEARISFTEPYRDGVVHGGMIPLFFDEFLGIFVSERSHPDTRTAYLKVDHRFVVPVGRALRATASIDKVEGRKTFVVGRLLDGVRVLAEAEGLFVGLRSADT